MMYSFTYDNLAEETKLNEGRTFDFGAARRLRRLTYVALAATALAFLFAAWTHRERTLQHVQLEMEQTSRLLEEHAQRLFASVSHNLNELAWFVESAGWEHITTDPDLLRRMDQMMLAPEAESIWLADAEGMVRFTTLFRPTPKLGVGDRAYFQAHLEPHTPLYVGDVILGKISGEPFFPVSRRIVDADGRFLGVAQISEKPEYFLRLYGDLSGIPGSSVALVNANGSVLAAMPKQAKSADAVRYPPAFMTNLSSTAGQLETTSPLTGERRLYDYRRVEGLPLYVLHARDISAVTGQWLRGAALYIAFALVSLATLSAFAWAAYRRTQELERAHGELERRISERTRHLQTLNEMGVRLGSELDLQRLVQAITEAGVTLSGAKFGAFFYNLVNESGETYTLYSLSGAPREAFANYSMPRNTAIFGPTFRGEGIVRSDDITQDPRYAKNAPHQGVPSGHLTVRSYLAVPVVSRSGAVHGGLFSRAP